MYHIFAYENGEWREITATIPELLPEVEKSLQYFGIEYAIIGW